MGFTGPILVPQECAGLPADLPGVESAPFAEQLCGAPTCSSSSSAWPRSTATSRCGPAADRPLDKKRLKVVERLFRQAASTEAETRPAGRRMPRRFIGVNVIYNQYWPMFTGLCRRQHQSVLQPGAGRHPAPSQ